MTILDDSDRIWGSGIRLENAGSLSREMERLETRENVSLIGNHVIVSRKADASNLRIE